MTNIWLIPASNPNSTKNLFRSIAGKIDVDIRQELIKMRLPYDFAWGAKLGRGSNNYNKYEKMNSGDICLFYTADLDLTSDLPKAYRWIARIKDKINDESLSNKIWPPGADKISFPLIYFLDTPVQIYLTTSELAGLLSRNGEKYRDAPKGFASITDTKTLEYVSETYTSPEGFLLKILKDYAQEEPAESTIAELYKTPQSESIAVNFVDNLMKIHSKTTGPSNNKHAIRHSRHSKAVGDEAELFVLDLLRQGKIPDVQATNVQHVANQKFGWDIQYTDQNGNLIRVEVKGTTCKTFQNFEITANELSCMLEGTTSYHIYLVAGCKSRETSVQIIHNMSELISNNIAEAIPINYRIRLLAQ